jgi:hypothetical protein
MSGLKLVYPVPKDARLTQTYEQHVAYAKKYNLCYMPGGACPNGYYYGAMDWADDFETPCKAGMDGRLEVQNQGSSGYGLNVRITGQDGYYLVNAHFSRVPVNIFTGADVKAGQIIGYMGYSGNCRPPGPSGTHFHFELRLNGIPIDPAPFLVGVQPEPIPVPPPEPFVPLVFDRPRKVRCTTNVSELVNLRDRANKEEGRDIGDLRVGMVATAYAYIPDGPHFWYVVSVKLPRFESELIAVAAAYHEGMQLLEEAE